MLTQIVGSCFAIRHQLKALGCQWDSAAKCWVAPAETYEQAQKLADDQTELEARERKEKHHRLWMEFMGTLPWCNGSFTSTVWEAALRAASLGIEYQVAWTEIASRVRVDKRVGDGWFDRNIGRAYAAVGDVGADGGTAGGKAIPRTEKKEAKPVFKNEVLSMVALAAVRDGESVGMRYLAERSPIDPRDCSPHDFLSALYEPGERVVVFDKFSSQGQWVWSDAGLALNSESEPGTSEDEGGFRPSVIAHASVYERSNEPFERPGAPTFSGKGPDGVWYLCNPVTGNWLWMDDVAGGDAPHWSRRFQDCVTSWRYMVLESDKATPADWIAMAVQLPLRISAIYTSGGKSVHVLVRVDARTKGEWDAWRDEIKPIAVTLGADAGCMSAVRLTRLPGCMRGPKHQRLLYLNPSPDMRPISVRKCLREVTSMEVSK